MVLEILLGPLQCLSVPFNVVFDVLCFFSTYSHRRVLNPVNHGVRAWGLVDHLPITFEIFGSSFLMLQSCLTSRRSRAAVYIFWQLPLNGEYRFRARS